MNDAINATTEASESLSMFVCKTCGGQLPYCCDCNVTKQREPTYATQSAPPQYETGNERFIREEDDEHNEEGA